MTTGEIWDNIMKDYKGKINIFPMKAGKTPYSVITRNEINFPIDRWEDPDMRDLFDMLHEIGHILTNEEDMKFYEKEYLATVWAVNHCKKYGVRVSKRTQNDYQRHINSYANKCKTVHMNVIVDWN